jgi:hypothetical protein
MVGQWFTMLVLAVYLESVLPSPLGVKSHPLAPFKFIYQKIMGREAKVMILLFIFFHLKLI